MCTNIYQIVVSATEKNKAERQGEEVSVSG